jgi:glucose-1-phosphatase
MIKTIIFDLGGVIVPFDYRRGHIAMRKYCGLQEREIQRRLAEGDLVVEYESGRIESDEFHREVCHRLGVHISFDEFSRIWSSIFFPETLIAGTWVTALGRRHRLVLLSNTNDIHYRMLEKNYPILHLFPHKILSHQVGAMKPAPEIYRAALRAADSDPDECFFTDDNADNVEAAIALGIDAVEFISQAQIEKELKSREVEW